VPESRSLLSRLEHPSPPGRRDLPGDVEEALESIHSHLQLMLNTRRGAAQTVPEFGTSDFSDFFRGYTSVERLRDEIARSIALYEPRLTDVQVIFEPHEDDPYRVHFEILATVVSEEGDTPAVFRTELDGSGEVRVSRG
jgi:type VI secretion system lysozyme-like protein